MGEYINCEKLILLPLRGYIHLFFLKKIIFGFLMFIGPFKVWRIPLSYVFLLFRPLDVSNFYFKIDSSEKYSLATDIARNFTCFKTKYYTRKSIFLSFSYGRVPRKTPYKQIWRVRHITKDLQS